MTKRYERCELFARRKGDIRYRVSFHEAKVLVKKQRMEYNFCAC
jgi:hypothetical protein